MTSNEFATLCSKYLVEPALALENDDIKQALIDRDEKAVESILREQF